MNKNEIGYRLYRKWFYTNLPLFILSIILYLYFRFFTTSWLVIPSFMFILMTMGWGATALTGMISNKKQWKKDIEKGTLEE